jgi:hypothetical protein
VDPRAGLDDMENRNILTLLGLELRSLNRPACSESLYRERYPGSSIIVYLNKNVVLLIFIVLNFRVFTPVACLDSVNMYIIFQFVLLH